MADHTPPNRSDTTLYIKENSSPAELARTLTELLPGILERRFKMDPLKAKSDAPLLAHAIAAEHERNSSVSRAGNVLRDSSFKLACGPAAPPEECDALRDALKPLVNIRVGSPSGAYLRTSSVRLAAGIVWSWMVQTLGRDREWEREQQTPNAVVGIRG
jgi:hypothetical protein